MFPIWLINIVKAAVIEKVIDEARDSVSDPFDVAATSEWFETTERVLNQISDKKIKGSRKPR